MVQSGQWVLGIEGDDHLAGVQEFAAGSNLQKIARAIWARTDSARAWHHPSLQSTAAKRAHGVARRSYRAAEPGRSRHRLLRAEDERDFSACVAAEANRRADHPGAWGTPLGGRVRVGFSS